MAIRINRSDYGMRAVETTKEAPLWFPTRADIDAIVVGGQAPNCFGRMAEVVEIYARRDDINGRRFICYYTAFGENNGRISNSLKEDELSAGACTRYNSLELQDIETVARKLTRRPCPVCADIDCETKSEECGR